MKCIVYGSESVCPECNGFLIVDIDVGDGFRYDTCGGYDGCGFKRKRKKKDEQSEVKRQEST